VKRHAPSSAGGFTLIELLIVVIIIGILAAIAIPMYLGQRDKAKDAAVKAGIHSIQIGVLSYAVDHGVYPSTGSVNGVLSGTYVDRWPTDPFTKAAMQSSSSVGSYTYTNNTDSYALVGHLSTSSDFSVGASGGAPAPDPTSFTAITGDLMALQLAYFAKHGTWPRTWTPYCYTDLGLDPAEYAAAIGNVYYKPVGSTLQAKPAAGYVMTVTGAGGQTLVLTSQLNWNLVYDSTSGQWYYHTIDPSNLIDISTLMVTPS